MGMDFAVRCPLVRRSRLIAVVELNRAVAVAMCEGPEQGLALINDLLARENSLTITSRTLPVRICARRLGRIAEARASFEKALALAPQEPDRRFLARRIEELKENPGN